jgi:hypothetical protein
MWLAHPAQRRHPDIARGRPSSGHGGHNVSGIPESFLSWKLLLVTPVKPG